MVVFFLSLVLSVLSLYGSVQQAVAQTPTPIIITCTGQPGDGGCGDTFNRSDAADTNYGLLPSLIIQQRRHLFIKFSQAQIEFAIPDGSVATSGILYLYLNNVSNWNPAGDYIDIHKMITPWVEGTGNCSGTCPGTTWNCPIENSPGGAPSCSVPWNGAVAVTDYVSTPSFSILHNNLIALGYKAYDVTSDVNAMALTSSNEGWLLKKRLDDGNNDPGRAVYLSRQTSNEAQRPYLALIVEQSTPTPTAAPTLTITDVPTNSPTVPTPTPDPFTPTDTPTRTETPTRTDSPTDTPTITPTPTFTQLPTYTPRDYQIGDVVLVYDCSGGGGLCEYPDVSVSDVRSGNGGSGVIAWHDGALFDVYGRRIDRDIGMLGSEFQVNISTSAVNLIAKSATNPDNGNFIIGWDVITGVVPFISDVRAQRYSSSGATLGSDFRVNTFTPALNSQHAIAANDDGNYILSWNQSASTSNPIITQRYNSSGSTLGSSIQASFVNQPTTAFLGQFSDVVYNDDNTFVVVWSGSSDGYQYGIFGRKFTSSGAALSNEFQINTYTFGNQIYPAISGDRGNQFVVVWQSNELYGQIIRARRYTNDIGIGSDFQISTGTMQYASRPAVCMMEERGDFVVAWGNNYVDGYLTGVNASHWTAAGELLGEEFAVNSERTGKQERVSAACDGVGRVIFAYGSTTIPDPEAYTDKIHAIAFDFPTPTPIPIVPDAENGEVNGCGCCG